MPDIGLACAEGFGSEPREGHPNPLGWGLGELRLVAPVRQGQPACRANRLGRSQLGVSCWRVSAKRADHDARVLGATGRMI
jgi:hypothetical protein